MLSVDKYMTIIRYDDVLARPIGIGENLDISVIEWIIQQIEIANDGIIRVKTADLKKVLGPNCEKKSDSTLYMGLRYSLKKYGIDVKLRTSKDRTKIFVISNIQHKHDK